ncbi:putative disease resistance protein RGA3 [Quercus robur]|uniref:putative disease resistance protein RGA3 n=1 Tax=Quercus robur TaxID=38942 RepID=UPI002163AFE9|nr:putative disease resistance protein RGA3 [Quercus robur]XP_050274018.1 putative disease resistance protein RGA3 [Quercus robur]XP_050274020.1 putative disease resistance protein RGA3 [Quercus robur]XP_050274021.1 putative disease resistance protein RGA3 [Quercus robur]XP_050274022.1 putative disease resistance protein RGA3 [Quercus robur]
MAEGLVTGLIDQLASIADREAERETRLVVGVGKEIRMLEGNLRSVKAVLNDAEKRELKDGAVKRWLKRLNDVCYEIDDVVDELNTELIKSAIQKEEENTVPIVQKKKVCSFISSPSRCFDKLARRHVIARKIKDLNEILDEISKEKDGYTFQLTNDAAPKIVEQPQTISLVDVPEIYGRDRYRDELMRLLLENDGVRWEQVRSPFVISLVGMGGIGKTALARLAYNDPNVQAHFEIKGWVCVSDPFDQCKVAKAIIEAFGGGYPFITVLQSLLEKIYEIISGKKFFLVLDDLWTGDFTIWETFRLALKYGVQGSKILVTTCDINVAKMIASEFIINLEVLCDEDCMLLFCKTAFFGKNSKEHNYPEDLSRKIVIKCHGLPLVTKILGGLMHFKGSREEWVSVLDSNLWELEDVQIGLWAPLLLSYFDLSSPLKRCFSYCAIFPKDYVFSVDELVFMWMAQGYIESKANMEIVAREYFENLAIRSFFQDFTQEEYDGKIVMRCKMHDIVHDFAQLLSKKECCTVNSEMELQSNYEYARHLHLEIPRAAQFPVSIYRAKLRTLIFVYRGDYNLSDVFQHLRCLRTLTLYFPDAMFKELPNEMGYLIHLRYLKLVNYRGGGLPETICNLCNLQLLEINFCSDRFKKSLQGSNLSHLIWDDPSFTCLDFPRGIERMISLKTISNISISVKDDSKGCGLGELQNFNHLKGAFQIKGLGHMVDAREIENAQLKKKTGLHTLKLCFNRWDGKDTGRKDDALVLNALEPPPNLVYLRIEDYQATRMSSNWMMSLTKLKMLFLQCFIELECLPPLGKLPFLESLRILEANSLKKVGVEFLGIEPEEKKDNIIVFPNLKSLIFERMWVWEEWLGIEREEEEEECIITLMPCLQELKIRHCPKLKSLPDFFPTTPSKNSDMNNSQILKEHVERGTGRLAQDFPHPNIQIDDWSMCTEVDSEDEEEDL